MILPDSGGRPFSLRISSSRFLEWVAQVSLLSKLACRRQEKDEKNALLGSIPSTNPDFLWSLVSSLHSMRLSSKERRTRGPVQSCVQEIGAIDGCPMRIPRVEHLFFPRYPLPSFAFFAKGGIVKSHPSTSHAKQSTFVNECSNAIQYSGAIVISLFASSNAQVQRRQICLW